MQKEFVLETPTLGARSFVASFENSTVDGRMYTKQLNYSINGTLSIQRLPLQNKILSLNVIFPREEMEVIPVPSGTPQRGRYQELMDYIEETVVWFTDWEGNTFNNAVIMTKDLVPAILSPATYPRFVSIEIIIPERFI